jgi:hypothetical protein
MWCADSRSRSTHFFAFVFGLGALGLIGFFPFVADANEVYLLTYRGPAGCPSETRMRADVASHTHDLSSAEGVHVDLTIVKHDSDFLGELVATDAASHVGHRTVSGRTCSEVAHALAFLTGLAIELGGRIEPEPAALSVSAALPTVSATPATPSSPEVDVAIASPPSAPSATVAAPTPIRSDAPSASDASTTRLAWALGLGAEARGGLANSPQPVVRLAFEIAKHETDESNGFVPSARLSALGGRGQVSNSLGTAQLWLIGGALEVCPVRWGGAHWEIRPCTVGEAGAVQARGSTQIDPRDATVPWGALGESLRFRWAPTERFFAELSGGLLVPLVRTRYFFNPDADLYVVPSVTANGGLVVGVRLGDN